jgi:hypothetical protein
LYETIWKAPAVVVLLAVGEEKQTSERDLSER